MKVILIFIVSIFAFSASETNAKIPVSESKQQTAQDEIVEHVQKNYIKTLDRIPQGKENLYGFENREMFENCEPGNPIRMLKIANEQEIETTNEWRVPLLIDGKYITLLTVIKKGKSYKIVDIGGKVLAETIDNYNNENKQVSFMIRDYVDKTYYVSFEYKSLSDKNFYKLPNKAQNKIEKNENHTVSLEEIIKSHNSINN